MKKNNLMKTLTNRTFCQNKGRNLVAVLAVFLTTLMFTTLFVLAQSISENIITMNFRQSGYDAQISFKEITGEAAEKIAGHPKVKGVGESIVLGLAENEKLAGRQVEPLEMICIAIPLQNQQPDICRKKKTNWQREQKCWINWGYLISWEKR
ncbi:MAG: hypothetical protein ACLRV8_12390 [Blautia hansenii]